MTSLPPPPPPKRVIPIRALPAEPEDLGMFSAYEKQVRIYPRSVKGLFANLRWVMVWVTQLVFYGLPGCPGTVARRCCLTCRSGAFLCSIWCCIRRT